MNDFIIVTDSSADLSEEYLKEHNVLKVNLNLLLDGQPYSVNNENDLKVFYEKMRNGMMPTTSQVNPEQAKQVLIKASEISKNILFVAFSSGLSGTYQSIKIAVEDLTDSDSELNVCVIDSLSASLGQGLLIHKAVLKKENGASFEETCAYLEDLKTHICHLFTVDDLGFLQRGGRISKGTAILGSMINIKPLLIVDNEGHLINVDKVRGRKKSIASLADMMEAKMGNRKDNNDIVFISHGDCIEDAHILGEEIKKRFGIKEVLYNYVGPVIGSHSGPGTIALFFEGENR